VGSSFECSKRGRKVPGVMGQEGKVPSPEEDNVSLLKSIIKDIEDVARPTSVALGVNLGAGHPLWSGVDVLGAGDVVSAQLRQLVGAASHLSHPN
jgi:hypothetical protein